MKDLETKRGQAYLLKDINPKLWEQVKFMSNSQHSSIKSFIVRALISYMYTSNKNNGWMPVDPDIYKYWPRKIDGILHFKDSRDAVLYGKMIAKDEELVKELNSLHDQISLQCEAALKSGIKTGDELMIMATDAQFHREAYESAIKNREG